MPDFVKLAAVAKRLVEANGRAVKVIKANRTPADSTKPWQGTSATPHESEGGGQFPVRVAFVPASGSGFGKMLQDAAGQLTVAFEQVGLLATDSIPSGFTFEDVEQADRLRDGSEVWKIVTRGHLRPGDTSLLFVLGLAR